MILEKSTDFAQLMYEKIYRLQESIIILIADQGARFIRPGMVAEKKGMHKVYCLWKSKGIINLTISVAWQHKVRHAGASSMLCDWPQSIPERLDTTPLY